jgi:hypothetical protein
MMFLVDKGCGNFVLIGHRITERIWLRAFGTPPKSSFRCTSDYAQNARRISPMPEKIFNLGNKNKGRRII